MKKLLISLLSFVLFSHYGYSQRVRLAELINITQCKDYPCFNDFIVTKGFCFDKVLKDNPTVDLYRFSSCDIIPDGPRGIDTKNQASYGFITTGSTIADIGTSSNAYYRMLLTELRDLGFVSYSTDDSDSNAIRVEYKSTLYSGINVLASTYKVEKEGVGSWTFWNFGVRRDKFSSSDQIANSTSSRVGYITDTDGSTNLRSQPTASSKLIQKVYNNTNFSVVSRAGDWLKIKLPNGNVGYVHKTRVKFTN